MNKMEGKGEDEGWKMMRGSVRKKERKRDEIKVRSRIDM